MSVIATVRLSGDPATIEQQFAAHADAIGRIMDVARRHGLIAHRWYGADGQCMAIDEWPDADSFNASSMKPNRTSARSCRLPA
jgi:hypothetical protein